MSPQNRLIQIVILKLLFIFISVIFERLARKGRSSFGKIITHSEVSMIESIYGQNGKVVLSPSGTLSVSFKQVFLECAENSTNLGNQFGSKRENKNPYLVSQLILKRSVTFLLDIWTVLEVKISTSPRPKSAVFQFTENLKKSWGQRRKGNPIRYLVEISSGFSVNHPLPATFSASKSQEP